MLIKACLNGSREPGEHQALPLTPEELAHEAQRSVAAGAGALHIHPRNADGKQTLFSQACGAAIVAIRAACPGVPIGVSTAAWIEPDVTQRLRLVQSWETLPDFASVNFSEPGAAALCSVLLVKGIGVEAGLATAEDARLLVSLDIAEHFLRVLIEPQEVEVSTALVTVVEIEHMLNEAGVQLPRLLHGDETAAWPVLEAALARGYDTRIGLEDTLTLPDSSRAKDNAELVAFACQRARENGRL